MSERRPNLVILTSGRSGSTLLVRMLLSMGWQANDIDHQWGESPQLVGMNAEYQQSRRSADQLADAARRYLAGLTEPWVLKDPGFGFCWDIWLPILADWPRVAVLLSERDMDAVEASYRRRGWNTAHSHKNRRAAELAFSRWAGQKLKVRHEQLCEAALLVDQNRL